MSAYGVLASYRRPSLQLVNRYDLPRGGLLRWGLPLALVFLGATAAAAGGAGSRDFTATEYRVLGGGLSSDWHRVDHLFGLGKVQIGGEDRPRTSPEFGVARPDDEKRGHEGPSRLGDQVKAGALSALLPGAGQFYNGQKSKAYLMGGIEASIWTMYFVFDAEGNNRRRASEQWAGIYAGTRGGHNDRYWQDVGHFRNSDDFNESVLREARTVGENPSGLIGAADAWQWANEDRRFGYSRLRASGNKAYDHRNFMILFAVLNRAVSVVDAVIGAGSDDQPLAAEVLGMQVELRLSSSLLNPGAGCVVSRRF